MLGIDSSTQSTEALLVALGAEPTPHVREAYADLRERTARWTQSGTDTEGTA